MARCDRLLDIDLPPSNDLRKRLLGVWLELCDTLHSRRRVVLKCVAMCVLIGHAGTVVAAITAFPREDCQGDRETFASIDDAVQSGMLSYLKADDRCFNLGHIEVVVVTGTRITSTFVWTTLPTIYLGHVEWSDGFGWHVVRPPPSQRLRKDLLVGLCVRPIGIFDFPANTPEWRRKALEALLPKHHDVQARKIENGEANSVTRGFFAVDMVQALLAFSLWMQRPFMFSGFVPGEVLDSAHTAGPCQLSPQTTLRYYRVRTNVITSSSSHYHLGRYNCQHWAAEQLP